MNINEKILEASRLLHENNLTESLKMVIDINTEISANPNMELSIQIMANLGGVMIDLGGYLRDESLIERGTKYCVELLSVVPEVNHLLHYYYFAANGYNSLWDMHSKILLKKGSFNESMQESKRFYRKGIDLVKKKPELLIGNTDLFTHLIVNYANLLDSVRRSIESVTLYNYALQLNPLMGEALGNKGITLFRLAQLAHGHIHTFYLESQRLFETSLKQSLPTHAKETFENYLSRVNEIIKKHGEMKAEDIEKPLSSSPFIKYLREFCIKHELFLTPTTMIGDQNQIVLGDPLFISYIVAPLNDEIKFSRYITYLNQIKQDYILARYLLIQSQYKSETVDAIDEGVLLYYPLDYSLYSSYIQMLMISYRLAVDVLDKISIYIRDYFHITSISERDTNFRTIYSTSKEPLILREELVNVNNPFLYALHDLSIDLHKDGYYQFIYERRNLLTHRFVVVHDMMPQGNDKEIPRIYRSELLRECIQTMQITRAAVIYLILMTDFEEKRLSHDEKHGIISGLPVDEVFKWRPSNNL